MESPATSALSKPPYYFFAVSGLLFSSTVARLHFRRVIVQEDHTRSQIHVQVLIVVSPQQQIRQRVVNCQIFPAFELAGTYYSKANRLDRIQRLLRVRAGFKLTRNPRKRLILGFAHKYDRNIGRNGSDECQSSYASRYLYRLTTNFSANVIQSVLSSIISSDCSVKLSSNGLSSVINR